MSDRYNSLRIATRRQVKSSFAKPVVGSGLGPTLSFKEVVAKYGIKPGKLRASMRFDEHAPKPRSVFNGNGTNNVYYDRAEIIKYVKANLEKLK